MAYSILYGSIILTSIICYYIQLISADTSKLLMSLHYGLVMILYIVRFYCLLFCSAAFNSISFLLSPVLFYFYFNVLFYFIPIVPPHFFYYSILSYSIPILFPF